MKTFMFSFFTLIFSFENDRDKLIELIPERSQLTIAQDTVSISYWKERAKQFEKRLALAEQELAQQKRISEASAREAFLQRQLCEESRKKEVELSNLIEEQKKTIEYLRKN